MPAAGTITFHRIFINEHSDRYFAEIDPDQADTFRHEHFDRFLISLNSKNFRMAPLRVSSRSFPDRMFSNYIF